MYSGEKQHLTFRVIGAAGVRCTRWLCILSDRLATPVSRATVGCVNCGWLRIDTVSSSGGTGLADLQARTKGVSHLSKALPPSSSLFRRLPSHNNVRPRESASLSGTALPPVPKNNSTSFTNQPITSLNSLQVQNLPLFSFILSFSLQIPEHHANIMNARRGRVPSDSDLKAGRNDLTRRPSW